jgi:hypothetical protein
MLSAAAAKRARPSSDAFSREPARRVFDLFQSLASGLVLPVSGEFRL